MSDQARDPAELDLDLTASEFQDYDGDLSGTSLNLDFSQLLSAASLRALAAIVVSLLILQVPDRSPRALAILLAIILAAWSIGGLM